MAKPKQLRWGLLGTARINRAIIEPVRLSKISTLLAVASRSPIKAAEYANLWEIPRFHSSYEALLDDPEIDVVYNSLPNSLHAEWSIKAMQHGKHVLCEKPLTTTMPDMDAVILTSKATRKVITEAFMYRHHPQTLLVKKMIDDGLIGDVQLIQGSFCYTNTRDSDVRFNPSLGGGSLWDVGCYPISYARYITGTEAIEAYGQQITGDSGIDLFYAGQLLFPGNVVAQFECSFISPHRSVIVITGSKGRITIPVPYKPGLKEKILIESGDKVKTIPVKGAPLYSGEVNDIENSIINGIPPRISLDYSRGNVATIEALYQSARLSKPIGLSG